MKKLAALSLFLLAITAASFAQNSGSIMAAAYKKAAKEHKNVFVMFHASWCGWCKKLDASMEDVTTKKYFDDNYVTVHLTVMEIGQPNTPGADVFLKKYNGEKAGLPFFIIMDKAGNRLGDSFFNGQNMGCPAAETEVNAFVELLKKTSKINEEQQQAVVARFRQNEAK